MCVSASLLVHWGALMGTTTQDNTSLQNQVIGMTFGVISKSPADILEYIDINQCDVSMIKLPRKLVK